MSFKAFVWAWDQDVPNPDFHHVLLALANIAPLREVRASVPYIAGSVRRSPRKVRAALAWMVEADIITITERPGRCDIIRLNIPKDFVVTMEEDEDLEAGTRGRPKKTPAPSKTHGGEAGKPLANPLPPCADEPKEPEEEPRGETVVSLSSALPNDVAAAFEAYCDIASVNGWTVPAKLTSQRRRALNARLADCGGLASWRNLISSIPESEFLSGRTHARFAVHLDFVLQPSSFAKLCEGFYHGNRTPSGGPGGPGSPWNAARRDAIVQGFGHGVEELRRRYPGGS